VVIASTWLATAKVAKGLEVGRLELVTPEGLQVGRWTVKRGVPSELAPTVWTGVMVSEEAVGTKDGAQIESARPVGFGYLLNWATCGSEAATVVDAVDREGGNPWGRPVMP
jgi:hypothetical protein